MTYRFRENVERMSGYVPGFQPGGADVIKINTNENPYPASPRVFEALAKLGGEQLRKYPPVLWGGFRKAAARLHGVKAEQIICGNGGDELLSILVRCCCDWDRPLAYPAPTYSLYPVLAEIQGCAVMEVPFGKAFGIPELLYKTGAALTIVCNPNAPTGTLISKEALAGLAEKIEGVLLIDEAYVDFAPANCAELINRFDNVAILRSMSKGYSLAGMRFGYVMASERIVEAMMKVKDSYNVNIAAQVAATAAIEDQAYFKANVAKVIEQRERLTRELRELGFEVGESFTNFLLVRIDRPSAKTVYEQLVKRNIYIRYFDLKGLEDKLRISIGTAQQNDRLMRALKDIVK